jgi:hypothetical protein
MDASYDLETETVTVGSTDISLPSHVFDLQAFENVVVVALSGRDGGNRNPDVSHPGMPRNLVGLDEHGHRWTVARDPSQSDDEHYRRLYAVYDRCIALRDGDGWTEVDLRDGSIVETLPRNRLRVGNEVKTFPNDVAYVRTFGSMLVVVESGDNGRNVSAFDRTGTRLWQRRFFARSIDVEDGKLVSTIEAGMGRDVTLEHDPDTGEPVAIRRSFDATTAQLESLLPADLHHLIDNV